MSIPIIDLHCDLLSYLRLDSQNHSPLDPISNCSIPLLEQGNVRIQTLALWSHTSCNSYQRYREQLAVYHSMLSNFKGRVAPITDYCWEKEQIYFNLAIENASCLLEEDEPFELFIPRLNALSEPLLYISLTWNEENRFGGGALSHIGLKREGEIALEVIAEKKIAIDLSHASDALAEDILHYIHKKGLALQPLASHSNYRSVLNCPRNITDTIAKEIAAMKGIIGLNFIKIFIGKTSRDFLKHIQYGINLIGEDALALGGDIWGGIPTATNHDDLPYYLEFGSSACYPALLRLLKQELSPIQIRKMAYLNAEKLLIKQGLV